MFEPGNDLERLLIAAARDETQRATFTNALLSSDLYVSPLSEPDDQGRVSGVRAVDLQDGTTAAAIFTAPERATEIFGKDILFIGNVGRSLLDWLRPGPVILNPGSDFGVVWDQVALDMMIDGVSSRTLEKETQILLGHPAKRPDELIARLTRTLGTDKAIQEAYLLWSFWPGQENGSWLLGVKSSSPWSTVQPLIHKAVQGYNFAGSPLDAVDLDTTELSSTLRTGIPIISPKKKGGFLNFLKG